MRMGYELELDRNLSIGDSSGVLIGQNNFAVYRDSLIALLVDDRKLIVRGVYGPNETSDQGRRRAMVVLSDIAPTLSRDRYEIQCKQLSVSPDLDAEVWVTDDIRNSAQRVVGIQQSEEIE